MQFLARVLLSVLAAVGFAHAGSGEPEFELVAIGMIDVGPDGTVHDYKLETRLEPAVAALVDGTVRGWQFEPVIEDGRPVIATTRMKLELEAIPRNDGYALRVADVTFGEPAAGTNPPPPYPRDALNASVGAMVSLIMQVHADGRVREVHVEQVSLTKLLGKRGALVRQRFANASRKAAEKWTFDTGEIVDGEPVAISVRVPVEFALDSSGSWTKRPTYHPGPYEPSPWAKPQDPSGTDAELALGDIQLLDPPRVRLRDNVVGLLL